jgi:sugar lactone lactonase YvrE
MRGRVEMGVRAVRVVLVLVLLGVAGLAVAAGPTVMPGFPLRAGANVMLMWMPYPGASSYNIYRSETPGGPYEKVGNPAANNYMDMNVPADKSVFYVVKPIVGDKESEPSPEVALRGIEPMKTPAFVGTLVTSDNKISLRWDGNPKAAFYNLYRSDTEKGDYKLLSSVQDTKFTDANVSIGKTYFYKVTSVSSTNMESPKADKPLSVKLARLEATEEKVASLVKKPVEVIGTFDVDGQVVLRSPKDLAIDADGNFYVTDGRGFVMYVSKELAFLRKVAERPADFTGGWGNAEGICYDPKAKELYVVFPDADAVRVFDAEGKLLRTMNVAKPDAKVAPKLDWAPFPVDAALGADGTLWVTDGAYYQLVGFNAKGEEVRRISLPREHKDRKPSGDDENLISPAFLAVSPKNGNIYVLEVAMQRATVYDKNGKFVMHIGGRGAQPGKFLLPAGISVDENGVAYVADRNMERLQSFDEKGNYTATYVNPKKPPEKQITIFGGAVGVTVGKGIIYYSDIMSEKVVAYKIVQ